MASHRIYFSSWGQGSSKLRMPAYAVLNSDDCRRGLGDHVAKAIARKNNMQVVTCRWDSRTLGDKVVHNYQVTLGKPVREGEWTDLRQIWISI